MKPLSSRHQFYVGFVLMVLLLSTRSTHLTAIHHLPSAAWAVFFLGGLYLRAVWAFPLLYAAVTSSDMLSIFLSDSGYICVFTNAYAMTLPSFASLWLAGRWYSGRHRDSVGTVPLLAITVFCGTLAAELLSSGGFYYLSGRFPDPNLAEFLPRLLRYFPHTLKSAVIYVMLAAAIHAGLVRTARGSRSAPQRGLPQ